ncbi:helix-turn-helix domain-containing protein [Kitasatospora sp. NPDC088391]|uniref:helix-turn-helix domain-containing protein n=1 Tax=Kitasatospora sp. NPDC088391 TaxID=3364074 RepID=UPI0037F3FBAA
MGRPERPITHRTKELTALAQHLRVLRQAADLTYTELSNVTGVERTRLSRAASGDAVPALEVVESYAKGCSASQKEIAEARKMWRLARSAETTGTIEPVVHITLVTTPRELWQAMLRLHRAVGRPSLRELEGRAGQHGELPHSTLHLVLQGRAQPSRKLLEHFLRACHLPVSEITRWLEAWDRIRNPRPATAQMSAIDRRLVNSILHTLRSRAPNEPDPFAFEVPVSLRGR